MNLPIDFESNPLVPVVIQDDATRDVLMVGFMNQAAFERTQETGLVHFWSRSRNKLWKKGETSGHTQQVVSMSLNCEENSLVVQVIQKGAVCHTGHTTCYYRQILPDGSLFETSDPVFDPADIYGTADESGVPEASENRVALWYGAYEYLAEHPLQDVSGTSRRLHSRDFPLKRIADELEELAGVLSGEHLHSGNLAEDLLLEGSQVLYWLAVLSVQLGFDGNRDLDLATAISSSVSVMAIADAVAELRSASARWRAENQRREVRGDDAAAELQREIAATVRLVARSVESTIGDPVRFIERDLAELRAKPYLADYFASTLA